MRHQEKIDFIRQLEKEGVEVVQQKLLEGGYAADYERIASKWLEGKDKRIPRKDHRFSRWQLILAIIGAIVAVIALVFTILTGGK